MVSIFTGVGEDGSSTLEVTPLILYAVPQYGQYENTWDFMQLYRVYVGSQPLHSFCSFCCCRIMCGDISNINGGNPTNANCFAALPIAHYYLC